MQDASGEYAGKLEQAGARAGIAVVGYPYENTRIERFFRTLKLDEVYVKGYGF